MGQLVLATSLAPSNLAMLFSEFYSLVGCRLTAEYEGWVPNKLKTYFLSAGRFLRLPFVLRYMECPCHPYIAMSLLTL